MTLSRSKAPSKASEDPHADDATPAPEDKGKQRALDSALSEIEKSYGKGAIMRLGEGSAARDVRGISTSSISLDIGLGGSGLPRGRVVEIFGPESSGNAEHALDPAYARKLGVALDDLLVSQPDNGEQALDIVETLVRSNAVAVVVIDSVAALVPRAEIEGEMGDSFVGVHARLMSQAMRKLTAAISKSETLVIFINQIREKIGVMFGSPETTTGGRALKFYASVRLDIRRIGQIKEGEEVIGNRTKVTVVKNKVAPPFRKVEFDILYNEGISREGDLLDLGLAEGIVLKSGTWFSLKDPQSPGEIRIGQGRERARTFLRDNPDLARILEQQIRAKLVPAAPEATPPSAAPPALPAGSAGPKAPEARPAEPKGAVKPAAPAPARPPVAAPVPGR
jgi:recombination protein RecA